MIAYAAAADVARGFLETLNQVIIYPLITLMMTIALIVFLWGSFQLIISANAPAKREEGRKHIMWGIIGMLVMVSAYAILSIATGTFGIRVPL
ncbi:MAG: hypothetical protein WDZ56_01205 [Candidatus Paceibacterota bacterium]